MHKRIAIYLKLYNEYLMDYILKGIKENKLMVNIINLPDKPCYFYPVLFFQTMHYKDVVWSQLQHYRGFPSWYNSFQILLFINNSFRINSRLYHLNNNIFRRVNLKNRARILKSYQFGRTQKCMRCILETHYLVCPFRGN